VTDAITAAVNAATERSAWRELALKMETLCTLPPLSEAAAAWRQIVEGEREMWERAYEKSAPIIVIGMRAA
jgi:hypothetical protein